MTAGLLAAASPATAAGLNDPRCKPTSARPNPVIVVHGQGGNYQGMNAVTSTLVGAGYCAYAMNYGAVPGGAFGQDHLSNSADQIKGQIDQVLAQTGASKVDVVGHSAGTGVLDNYILKKGGAARVRRLVSFGGLHHPYAHAGIAKVADATLYLPNLVAAARKIIPNISTSIIVKTALDLYAGAGAPLGMVDPALRATMESNFTSDLFDPDYWADLHGDQSEPALSFVRIGQSERSQVTADAATNVCYTNIVAVADLVTGATAGFQDEAPNVENFTLLTTITANAHNDMLGDPIALAKMMSGLDSPCAPGPILKTASGKGIGEPTAADRDAEDAFASALAGAEDEEDGALLRAPRRPDVHVESAGCSAAPAPTTPTAGALLAFGLAIVGLARRRRSRTQRVEALPPRS